MAENRYVHEFSPGCESLTPFVEGLEESGVPAGARLIYEARNRVYELPVPDYAKGSVDLQSLNLKAYCVPNIVNRVAYRYMRASKARRAFENATRLIAMGINTARPVAFVEERGVLFGRSFFVSEQLGDEWKLTRGMERWDDFDSVADALAAYMANLHSLGVWMKDFTPGNVLIRRNGAKYDFALIDINRMEFGVKSHSKLMTNFQGILETSEAVALLARKFARISGLDENRTADDAVAVFRRKTESRRFRHKLKKLFKIKN